MSIFSKMKEELRALEEQENTEENVQNDEPLTPEEEAQFAFFEKLWDRIDTFFDYMEESTDRIINMLADMSGEKTTQDVNQTSHCRDLNKEQASDSVCCRRLFKANYYPF